MDNNEAIKHLEDLSDVIDRNPSLFNEWIKKLDAIDKVIEALKD